MLCCSESRFRSLLGIQTSIFSFTLPYSIREALGYLCAGDGTESRNSKSLALTVWAIFVEYLEDT